MLAALGLACCARSGDSRMDLSQRHNRLPRQVLRGGADLLFRNLLQQGADLLCWKVLQRGADLLWRKVLYLVKSGLFEERLLRIWGCLRRNVLQ
jgi:hypothetical protein